MTLTHLVTPMDEFRENLCHYSVTLREGSVTIPCEFMDELREGPVELPFDIRLKLGAFCLDRTEQCTKFRHMPFSNST